MKISAFSMCRNAETLYYPLKQSILSALPLVDEFVVAVGQGEPNDKTLALLQSIESPKLKIIETEWNLDLYTKGTVHAQQTDLAKNACTGDWLLYLQADEVIHEKDHTAIRSACKAALHEQEVEGFLFHYNHFWGDYDHVVNSHGWYQKEIRMIRNLPEIHSWESAQSFRHIKNFDGRSFRNKAESRKLRVRQLNAHMYHYGWVRPPDIMSIKTRELDRIHSHQQACYPQRFHYGDLRKLALFRDTHPAVMTEWMNRMDWHDELQLKAKDASVLAHKHEKWKNRMLTFIERHFFGGRQIATYRNYTLVK